MAASDGVLHAGGDAVQDVEEQRLEQRGVGPHGLEVEDLQPLERERVVEVVEEAGVAPAVDPLVQPPGQRPREQVGQREQSPLAAVEDIEVVDRFIDLAIFQLVQPVPVFAFQQDLHERVQEVQVLRCRVERERVDCDRMLAQSHLEVAPAEERGELPIAVAEIEDDRQRLVLLGVGHQEVEQEALAAAGGAEDQRVPDVLDVEVEGVRRVMRRLEDRPAPHAGGADRLRSPPSSVNRKLRSAAFVSSRARRRRFCALLPGTMLSQAFSRL